MTRTDGRTYNSVSNLYVIIFQTEMFEACFDRSEYIFFAVRVIFFSSPLPHLIDMKMQLASEYCFSLHVGGPGFKCRSPDGL